MIEVKYPDVFVQISGEDGNAFSIIARVTSALRDAQASPDEIAAFQEDATSGDYDHVLQTCMRWVETG